MYMISGIEENCIGFTTMYTCHDYQRLAEIYYKETGADYINEYWEDDEEFSRWFVSQKTFME